MQLSVVICTYNRGKYIPMVLDSLRAQTLPVEEYEVLLVNNNSPDDTDSIVKSYIQSYPSVPIRYFVETNQGISHARNRGVNEAKGEIIAFIDDDETVEPDFLVSVKEFFTDYKDAGITSGPVIPVLEAPEPVWMSRFTARLITGAYHKGTYIKKLSPKDYPGTGHACFRKSLFVKYGIFNTALGRKGNSLMGAEDKDFFLRLMNGGEICYYLPSAKIYHHIPESKLTNDFFDKLTYAIGKSERVRTKNLGQSFFVKRVFSETVKWAASLVLWAGYTFTLNFAKANKLIVFRWNLTKGLLGH